MEPIDPRQNPTSAPPEVEPQASGQVGHDRHGQDAGQAGIHPGLFLMLGLILLGLVMGPWVLGQLSPETYRAWFVGGAAEYAEYRQVKDQWDQKLTFAREQGWDSALEFEEQRAAEEIRPLEGAVIVAEMERNRQWRGRLNGTMLAIVAVLAVAGLIGRASHEGRARLDWGLYGLAGLWLGWELALWDAIRTVDPLFVIVLLAVVLAGLWLPSAGTGRRRAAGG
ncbi:MAG: hypothetical protein JJU36_07990 [Phycisphaeraceae bacterium]|nr:hypothetical protein [Phycisphaeraceae bacterium]